MSGVEIFGALTALGLLVYLTVALLKPELFG
jgi:K+-transporting ATPase KdpF subunit